VRSAVLLAAFVLLALGVAGYLASNTGAGPAEAAAIAWDRPVPFRWSYSIVQGGGALVGWLLGAAIGPATLVVILLLGHEEVLPVHHRVCCTSTRRSAPFDGRKWCISSRNVRRFSTPSTSCDLKVQELS